MGRRLARDVKLFPLDEQQSSSDEPMSSATLSDAQSLEQPLLLSSASLESPAAAPPLDSPYNPFDLTLSPMVSPRSSTFQFTTLESQTNPKVSRSARRAQVIQELTTELKHSTPAPLLQYADLKFKNVIGEGSSGRVYKGSYRDTPVAIKVLKKLAKHEEEDAIREFVKEFEIMSAVRTPHAVRFFGAVLDKKICMVMEYCSRESLYHILNNRDYEVGWDQLFHYTIELTTCIRELHIMTPQVIHRDVKSLNFLVNEQFDVKVCDFGLSRFNTGSNLSTLQHLRGTYAYCAPEVYNLQFFSTRSDVYSIGIVFWELVTRCIKGRYERPYGEYNFVFDAQIIIQVAKSNLRPTMPEVCPKEWKRLIYACIDGAAENRPTCDMILGTLNELKNEYQANKEAWDAVITKPQPSAPTPISME